MDRGRARCEEELRNWIPVRYRVYKTREREGSAGTCPTLSSAFYGSCFSSSSQKQFARVREEEPQELIRPKETETSKRPRPSPTSLKAELQCWSDVSRCQVAESRPEGCSAWLPKWVRRQADVPHASAVALSYTPFSHCP